MTDFIFVLLCLVAVILAQELQLHLTRKAHAAQVKDLLNRLMARDFAEYTVRAPQDYKVVSLDELKAELQSDHEIERGVPIS